MFAAHLHRKQEDFLRKSEGSFQELEGFCEEGEVFFQRALDSYTHKFPKRSAASLMYLLRSRLGLLHSRLGLPHLCMSRNFRLEMEGFPNRGINFKGVYLSDLDAMIPPLSYLVTRDGY